MADNYKMDVDFDITLASPSKSKGVVEDEVSRGMEELGKETQDAIRSRLDIVLKNPSGHYRSRIDYKVISDTRVEVDDSGVVYGPWLEGVSRRNSSTRFKGYHTFRHTIQKMGAEADSILDPYTRRMVERLG